MKLPRALPVELSQPQPPVPQEQPVRMEGDDSNYYESNFMPVCVAILEHHSQLCSHECVFLDDNNVEEGEALSESCLLFNTKLELCDNGEREMSRRCSKCINMAG